MIYVFEDSFALDLEPLTLTRATFELRCGMLTHLERIRSLAGDEPLTLIVRSYLAEVVAERYPDLIINPPAVEAGLWMNGSAIWSHESMQVLATCRQLSSSGEHLIGGQLDLERSRSFYLQLHANEIPGPGHEMKAEIKIASHLWQLTNSNGDQIRDDFASGIAATNGLRNIPEVSLLEPDQVVIEEGAALDPQVVLDGRNGPIVISRGTIIGSHSLVTGPCYLGPDCIIRPGTRLSDVSLGPGSRVAGEISASIFQGWSNKQHDGYMGNSYVGEWVNLGANTVTSNLKNNYGTIRVVVNGRRIDSGDRFVGLFMGDHSKSAIGTLFGTGTRVGVATNVFGATRPPEWIPSFSWGATGAIRYDPDRFLQTAQVVKNRRNKPLTEAERDLFRYLYSHEESAAI